MISVAEPGSYYSGPACLTEKCSVGYSGLAYGSTEKRRRMTRVASFLSGMISNVF